ncbi:hypothetical protein ACKE5C_19255 (plasmid) [Aneurinibacillus thermoaerophilus]|uniref:Uncharacterized protein n=1 Tax=Aneurinibacillus thermoaerophilus TaxID=143495 RepID=A0ABX8YGI5_ANETH|nr:hypothetical protein [Aneurinibacillus thermoaerophilus]QYY44756.1 hypothetical protein K3F53_19120 [Aneurinibacillus thermoaerophilus]
MKQRITTEQLKELTPKQQERLIEQWYSRETNAYNRRVAEDVDVSWNGMPLLSIGQMIELLQTTGILMSNEQTNFGWHIHIGDVAKYTAQELCDALWEAVKSIL